MARTGGTPLTIRLADSTAASAAVGPTDRSMPPEMMTSVMPSATQALMLDCCRMLIRLCSLRKPGATAANTPAIRSNPIRVPKSLMFTLKGGSDPRVV